MKKYITLFSLITLFFIGMQQTHAQEKKTLDENQGKDKVVQLNEIASKEKQQSPEQKAKIAKLEMIDANSEAKLQLAEMMKIVPEITVNQQKELQMVFVELIKNINSINEKDKQSKKGQDAIASFKEPADLMIKKILNDEQEVFYNEYIEKLAKSDK